MRQFTSTICGAGCSLLLLALPAHALPEFQNAAAQPEIPRAHPPVSTADMTLFELIAGGIAEHRKQPEFAFEAFFDAAKKTRSAQVAAMAWRAAITARNPEGVVRAAKLWIDIDKSAELPYHSVLADAVERGSAPEVDALLVRMNETLGKNAKSKPGDWLARALQPFTQPMQAPSALIVWAAEPWVQKFNSNPQVLITYAQLLQRGGRPAEGCSAAQLAVRAAPNDSDVMGKAADVCWNFNADLTFRMLSQFLDRHPQDSFIRLVVGRVEQRRGQRATALKNLDLAVKHSPKNPKILYGAGQLAMECQDPVRAEKHFNGYIDAIRQENEDIDLSRSEVWLLLGNAALEQHALERAADYYAELLGGPYAAQAKIREAICLADLHRLDEALAVLKEAREELSLDAPALYSAEASLLIEAGRNREAHEFLEEAVKAYPTEPEIRYEAAMAAEAAAESEVAIGHLEALLAMNPEHVQANNALGYLLADRGERLDEARLHLEKAYRAAPLDPYILDSMGWLAYREGRYRSAIEFVRASLKRRYDPESALHLVEILCTSGRKSEAESILEESLKRGADPKKAEALARRFELRLPTASSTAP